jgi:hypothetical protein
MTVVAYGVDHGVERVVVCSFSMAVTHFKGYLLVISSFVDD